MSVNKTNLLSGRAQLVPYANLTADRYQFLSLNQAEPSLSSGLVGNVFFFHRPGVGVFGALIFGAVLVPYFFSIGFGRPANL